MKTKNNVAWCSVLFLSITSVVCLLVVVCYPYLESMASVPFYEYMPRLKPADVIPPQTGDPSSMSQRTVAPKKPKLTSELQERLRKLPYEFQSCDNYSGNTEQEQLMRDWGTRDPSGIKRKVARYGFMEYKHKVWVTYPADVINGTLIVRVNEIVKGKPTGGGSSFDVEYDGDVLQTCSSWDFFNGTYHFCCPMPIRCARLQVRLAYLNFQAYHKTLWTGRIGVRGYFLPANHVLWHNTITECPAYYGFRNTSGIKQVSKEHARFCVKPKWSVGSGYWMKRIGNWEWIEDGCIVNTSMNFQDIKTCLGQVSSLTLIGSSHVRYMYDYLAHAQGTLSVNLPVKHTDDFSNDVKYIAGHFAYEIGFKLNSMRDKASRGQKKTYRDAVVIMTGAWEQAFRDTSFYLDSSIPKLLKSLKDLKADPIWANARIIWFTNIAFPQNRVGQWSYYNNFVVSASNSIITPLVQELGIEVMDVFQMTRNAKPERECEHHFVCRLIKNKQNVIIGETGKKIIHRMLKQLCSTKTKQY